MLKFCFSLSRTMAPVVAIGSEASTEATPGNGSLRPHWYSMPIAVPSGLAFGAAATRAPRCTPTTPPNVLATTGVAGIQMCQLQRMTPAASLAAMRALPGTRVAGVENVT